MKLATVKSQSIPILLVEDDLVEAMAVKRALKELRVTNPLKIAENGEDALLYLREDINEKPGLILLDLNMPKMNGIELLTILKQDPALRRIPVIILTTSKHDEDKVATFDLSVAGYMVKPVEYQQFVETIRTINLYWTSSEVA
jgi:CheY-like chemotaxis protein